jgi:hypothetical protein
MEREGVPQKQYSPKVIGSLISDAKNALVPPAEYESLAMDPVSRAAATVYREMETTLRAANAVSFDDLLALPVEIFRKDESVLARYRDRFQFILVGTLTKDGSPRITPVEAYILDGHLLSNMIPRSLKALDLLRDPAFDALVTGESRFDELPDVMARLAAGSLPALCHTITYDEG